MALYTYISRDQLPGLDYNYGPDPRQTQLYNALGRNSGNNNGMNFFQKRGRSLENAFGTTGAALASIGNDLKEQLENSNRQKKFEQNMGDIYRSAGFNNADDYYNAKEAAERDAFGRIGFDIDDYWNKRADADIAGDKDTLSRLDASYNEAKSKIGNDENLARFNDIQEQLKNQSSRNYDEQKKAQERFADYRKNDYISQKINQDHGKFAGSAINTLSTAFDVMAPGAGILANSVQGGIEGIADELEDNGFQNFDWGRAGQNALIGATTGAVTGGINKGISNKLAKNGGNLFKGGNFVTKGLNTLGSSTAPGRIASTLATGAGRGAVSGAVGGATGAGLSAAMNGGDVLGSAAQGFQQGLTQGAMTGGIMAGANMAASRIPGISNAMRSFREAGDDWEARKANGESFENRGYKIYNNDITNRYTDGSTGYKDIALKFVKGDNDGIVKEIQIMTPNMQKAKYEFGGHELYEKVRTKASGWEDAMAKMNQLYAEAERADAAALNSASETSRPSLAALSGGNSNPVDVYPATSSPSRTTLTGTPSTIKNLGSDESMIDSPFNSSIAQNAQKVNTPETEVYRALSKDNRANKNNAAETLKTSRSEKLRGQAAQELLKQFGTIDKPTAKATNSVKTMQEIANAGFTKPGDIERIADNITGSNGEVNKLVQALVANSKPVNTYDGYDGKSIDEFIDDSIARHALDGINEGKAVKSQIKALFNSLESRRNGSVSMTDMPEDVMDVVRGLEAEAANYEGRSGMNYGTTTPDKLNAAKVLKDVATLLKDRTFETADMERVMTPEVAEGLKSLAPGNEQWAKYVDEKIMTAKTPQDLRSVQAPFVNIKKIIDNGYMNSMTYGGRVGNVANGVPTNRRTIINNAANAIFNSNIANRAKARVLSGAANRIEGTRADQPIRSLPTTTETQTQGEGSTPSTRIYDIIGRQEGLNNGEQARSAEYLAQAAQEAEVVPNSNNYATMGQQAPTTANTSVYNTIMGGGAGTQSYGGQDTGSSAVNGNSYFPATGDYWTDIIGRAMSAAIDADDVDAFGALYSMYQSQIANLQKQSASANQPQKITSTQQRANAAMSSLNRLSQMKPDLGYDLSGIPIIGGIATFGGNDYESEAKSLAQQIGYMVSGANIKEEEAFNIGKAYVPQPFDSEHARQTKLQRAYDIIRQYQNGYAVDDGSLV